MINVAVRADDEAKLVERGEAVERGRRRRGKRGRLDEVVATAQARDGLDSGNGQRLEAHVVDGQVLVRRLGGALDVELERNDAAAGLSMTPMK